MSDTCNQLTLLRKDQTGQTTRQRQSHIIMETLRVQNEQFLEENGFIVRATEKEV